MSCGRSAERPKRISDVLNEHIHLGLSPRCSRLYLTTISYNPVEAEVWIASRVDSVTQLSHRDHRGTVDAGSALPARGRP